MLTRRSLAIAALLGGAALGLPVAAHAQTADATALESAVADLRKAMLDGDKAKLDALTADQLSYGHSSGKLETKAQFIDVIASKKTVYKSISLDDPKSVVAGSNAIVRHIFKGEAEADGKISPFNVGILQVWTKQDGSWKLLARQAFKL